MRSLTCFHYRFTPSWQMTLITLAALVLFATLGQWQLHRAADKKQIIQAQKEAAVASPLLWVPGMALPKPYQKLRLQGKYLKDSFLLDNQIHDHQVGYHVLTPLLLNNGQCILINRGWISAGSTRQEVPHLSPSPHDLLDIRGEAYYPPKKQWVLGEEIETHATVKILERVNVGKLQSLLNRQIYPFLVRVDHREPYTYVLQPKAATYLSPARHYGYAFQWFLMGFTCLILFIVLNLKKEN